MSDIAGIIKRSFPHADSHILDYVQGVLHGGSEDFESPNDVYEAVGDMLVEVSGESAAEDDVKDVCKKLFLLLCPGAGSEQQNGTEPTGASGAARKLAAPVQLAAQAQAQANGDDSEELASIWLTKRDDMSKVDQSKLAKAEAKIKQKQDKQTFSGGAGGSGGSGEPLVNSVAAAAASTAAASASQVLSKKDVRMEARGTLNSKDIRIENFDLAYGDKQLISGATLSMGYGRRYGLVGRNGLGKSTLLRMMSSRQLMIPSHISVLHVEQEVTGDDTLALDSVLQCDERRNALLAEEKAINAQIASSASADPALSTRLSAVYAELEDMEADKAPARAACILNGLGFSSEAQSRATKTFSGGWRMRLALARALFSRPDLLLLDEPTNMLDMKAIIWLENYLCTWPSTILVVSHDRHFLDMVPTDIMHLHSRRLDTYKGDYSTFVKTRADRMRNQQKEYEAQMQARAHVQEFIDKFRFNAKRASLVQSKIKMLEKMPVLIPVEKEVEVSLKFPDESCHGLSPPILQLDEVGFRYDPKGRLIFSGVNLNATMESRICIVGENGAGKTTLLKVVMGDLSPTSGVRSVHRNLKIGYFAQHHVDQLDLSVSCLRLMENRFPGKPSEEYRRQLGSFGLTGDLALQRIGILSGGQKSRLAFAILAGSKPNFLVLDEPTNHLDIETIEALGEAINKYAGGVILVSHDERLIRMICKELWVCADGTVKSLEGGFDEYRKIVERELAAQQAVK